MKLLVGLVLVTGALAQRERGTGGDNGVNRRRCQEDPTLAGCDEMMGSDMTGRGEGDYLEEGDECELNARAVMDMMGDMGMGTDPSDMLGNIGGMLDGIMGGGGRGQNDSGRGQNGGMGGLGGILGGFGGRRRLQRQGGGNGGGRQGGNTGGGMIGGGMGGGSMGTDIMGGGGMGGRGNGDRQRCGEGLKCMPNWDEGLDFDMTMGTPTGTCQVDEDGDDMWGDDDADDTGCRRIREEAECAEVAGCVFVTSEDMMGMDDMGRGEGGRGEGGRGEGGRGSGMGGEGGRGEGGRGATGMGGRSGRRLQFSLGDLFGDATGRGQGGNRGSGMGGGRGEGGNRGSGGMGGGRGEGGNRGSGGMGGGRGEGGIFDSGIGGILDGVMDGMGMCIGEQMYDRMMGGRGMGDEMDMECIQRCAELGDSYQPMDDGSDMMGSWGSDDMGSWGSDDMGSDVVGSWWEGSDFRRRLQRQGGNGGGRQGSGGSGGMGGQGGRGSGMGGEGGNGRRERDGERDMSEWSPLMMCLRRECRVQLPRSATAEGVQCVADSCLSSGDDFEMEECACSQCEVCEDHDGWEEMDNDICPMMCQAMGGGGRMGAGMMEMGMGDRMDDMRDGMMNGGRDVFDGTMGGLSDMMDGMRGGGRGGGGMAGSDMNGGGRNAGDAGSDMTDDGMNGGGRNGGGRNGGRNGRRLQRNGGGGRNRGNEDGTEMPVMNGGEWMDGRDMRGECVANELGADLEWDCAQYERPRECQEQAVYCEWDGGDMMEDRERMGACQDKELEDGMEMPEMDWACADLGPVDCREQSIYCEWAGGRNDMLEEYGGLMEEMCMCKCEARLEMREDRMEDRAEDRSRSPRDDANREDRSRGPRDVMTDMMGSDDGTTGRRNGGGRNGGGRRLQEDDEDMDDEDDGRMDMDEVMGECVAMLTEEMPDAGEDAQCAMQCLADVMSRDDEMDGMDLDGMIDDVDQLRGNGMFGMFMDQLEGMMPGFGGGRRGGRGGEYGSTMYGSDMTGSWMGSDAGSWTGSDAASWMASDTGSDMWGSDMMGGSDMLNTIFNGMNNGGGRNGGGRNGGRNGRRLQRNGGGGGGRNNGSGMGGDMAGGMMGGIGDMMNGVMGGMMGGMVDEDSEGAMDRIRGGMNRMGGMGMGFFRGFQECMCNTCGNEDMCPMEPEPVDPCPTNKFVVMSTTPNAKKGAKAIKKATKQLAKATKKYKKLIRKGKSDETARAKAFKERKIADERLGIEFPADIDNYFEYLECIGDNDDDEVAEDN